MYKVMLRGVLCANKLIFHGTRITLINCFQYGPCAGEEGYSGRVRRPFKPRKANKKVRAGLRRPVCRLSA